MNAVSIANNTPEREAGQALLALAKQSGGGPSNKEVDALLARDPDWKVRDQDGDILYHAIRKNHLGLLKRALASGAPTHQLSWQGYGALHTAVLCGQPGALQHLITHGADVQAYGRDDRMSVLHLIVTMDNETMEALAERQPASMPPPRNENSIILSLLKAGAHIHRDIPAHPTVTAWRAQAEECAARVCAQQPINVAALNAEEVCYFANLGRVKELFQPDLWQQHPGALKQLLGKLPLYLSVQLLQNQSRLREIVQPPQLSISTWNAELQSPEPHSAVRHCS